jgi:hypothetical protein
MMRFCSECGIPLPEKAQFCPSCGASALDQLLAAHAVVPSGGPSPAPEAPPEEGAIEEPVEPLGEEGEVAAPLPEPPPGDDGGASPGAPSIVEAEAIPRLTLADAVAALRSLVDRRRLLWYGASVMLGWMLLTTSHLLAFVAAESPKVAVAWRLCGWGIFLAMYALASAVLAASVIAEIGPHLRLSWMPASGILRRMPALLGPAGLFVGIAGLGIALLAAVGMLARGGAGGRLMWALLFVPQVLLALAVGGAVVAAAAALVYGPALAVTDGGTFSQTLYRLRLLVVREGGRAVGGLLLILGASGLLGVLVQLGIGFVIREIERLALWASQGETAAVTIVGKEVISACLPGLWRFDVGGPFVPLRVESDLRLAGFLWAVSVIALRGAGMVIPLLLVSGCGAVTAWMLLERLARPSSPR